MACLINHRPTDLTDAVSIERDNFIVSWLGGPALRCTNRLGSAKMFDLHLFTGECVLKCISNYLVRFAPLLVLYAVKMRCWVDTLVFTVQPYCRMLAAHHIP